MKSHHIHSRQQCKKKKPFRQPLDRNELRRSRSEWRGSLSLFIFILFYEQRFPELQDVHSLFRAAALGVCVTDGVWAEESRAFFLPLKLLFRNSLNCEEDSNDGKETISLLQCPDGCSFSSSFGYIGNSNHITTMSPSPAALNSPTQGSIKASTSPYSPLVPTILSKPNFAI